MTTRPILFSAPMVRALLEGRKSQTRRIIKDPVPTQFPDWFAGAKWDPEFGMVVVDSRGVGRGTWSRKCPYGLPGDLLWLSPDCRHFPARDQVPAGPPDREQRVPPRRGGGCEGELPRSDGEGRIEFDRRVSSTRRAAKCFVSTGWKLGGVFT